MLDSCDLIACGAVVFGEIGLDNDLRIELIWHSEIRGLIVVEDVGAESDSRFMNEKIIHILRRFPSPPGGKDALIFATDLRQF
jgi:hypothetical protein